MSTSDTPKPKCFIAMPVAVRPAHVEAYEGDAEHWIHVLESLFVPAVEAAGFEPIRPVATGADLIHGLIISNLSTADLVLVDLSTHNPNVFFELGVRTSINLPIALVRDEHTSLPFDTSGINTYSYDSKLRGWNMEREREKLTAHIVDSVDTCKGENPLWRQFGLTIKAHEPETSESPSEAKLDLLMDSVQGLQREMDRLRKEPLRSPFTRARRHDEFVPATELLRHSSDRVLNQLSEENTRSFLRELGLTEPSGLPFVEVLEDNSVVLIYSALPDQDTASRIITLAHKYGVKAQISGGGRTISSGG